MIENKQLRQPEAMVGSRQYVIENNGREGHYVTKTIEERGIMC